MKSEDADRSRAQDLGGNRRPRTLLVASQPYILNSMPEISVSDQTAEEWGAAPSCFHLQPLFVPGVMYFISLVRFPSTDNPLMSVRGPGTVLDSG